MHTFAVVSDGKVESTVSLLVHDEDTGFVLKEFDDCERLSRRTVLTGKVERSATTDIDTVSLHEVKSHDYHVIDKCISKVFA